MRLFLILRIYYILLIPFNLCDDFGLTYSISSLFSQFHKKVAHSWVTNEIFKLFSYSLCVTIPVKNGDWCHFGTLGYFFSAIAQTGEEKRLWPSRIRKNSNVGNISLMRCDYCVPTYWLVYKTTRMYMVWAVYYNVVLCNEIIIPMLKLYSRCT